MARRPRPESGPDLFNPEPDRPSPVRQQEQTAATLPDAVPATGVGDISCAEWTDDQIKQVLAMLTAEATRRGLLPEAPHSPAAADTTPAGQEIPLEQVSAIRAASEAGMKPGRIARQFGVPLAKVKQVLAASP